MSLDIAAKTITPIRQTYDNVARRIGEGKPGSRYQEATFDLQPTTNFHYKPLWDTEHEVYDASRTAIVMEDWYAFTDPRQFYYSAYTMARAKQQEVADKNYGFVEKRQLLAALPDSAKRVIREILLPLRHVEWGANMNNCYIADLGYGTAITQVASFNTLDRLGIAQYLTRISLLLEENETNGLEQAKQDWLERDIWQDLRHAMEDMFVLDDWFETMVAQNVVMDGLIYPLIYQRLIDQFVAEGASSLALVTEFMSEWYAETERWTNALIKVTAAESEQNATQLSSWVTTWVERTAAALTGVASEAFDEGGEQQLAEVKLQLLARLSKQGLALAS